MSQNDSTPTAPEHKDPTWNINPGHNLPWHTEACFQSSNVIRCDGNTDRRRCRICSKEWDEPCNFDDDYS